QSASYELYRRLIGEAIDSDEGLTELIIIPHGELNLLPWAALQTEAGDKESDGRSLPYLIKTYAIQVESSVNVFYQEAFERTLTATNYAYAGFAPSYGGELLSSRKLADSTSLYRAFPKFYRQMVGSLRFNKEEVEEVAGFFSGGKYEIGEGATETNFKEISGQSSILHVASHGVSSRYNPALSHLIFSDPRSDDEDDGLLYAWEVYGMQLPADLTVLSACGSGAGAVRTGTSTMSLARAFKYAGSRDVLMSLWPVDDLSTFQLMRYFFQSLKEEMPKGKALQSAMLQHLTSEKNAEFTHPYFWSGFSMVGPGLPLVEGQAGFWKKYWWSFLIGLGILALLWLGRRSKVRE
ncbi:MAG: CHAT domain-containing protein, partial [Bacteroidota bacterium]